MTPGLTSNSRANSFIRIFFIEETAITPYKTALCSCLLGALYGSRFIVFDDFVCN
jgi:hypothetical protein